MIVREGDRACMTVCVTLPASVRGIHPRWLFTRPATVLVLAVSMHAMAQTLLLLVAALLLLVPVVDFMAARAWSDPCSNSEPVPLYNLIVTPPNERGCSCA